MKHYCHDKLFLRNFTAWISFKGATNFASNMDAILYRKILSDYLLSFGTSNYDLDFKLHQDNDQKHRSLLCATFLNFNNIVCVIKVVIERNEDWSHF
ncbi:hypothetical protein BpHYR1_013424 [Brachionus plicatilis]|uniref:Uncharacterized protein n=1 Tax=Brachionus plicatilis TaxID=10195 RepID=A0A3M7Q1Q4_BRAPC|nr:hypothetical protein BpHYR1_013424 [Brachionus plicatilis]